VVVGVADPVVVQAVPVLLDSMVILPPQLVLETMAEMEAQLTRVDLLLQAWVVADLAGAVAVVGAEGVHMVAVVVVDMVTPPRLAVALEVPEVQAQSVWYGLVPLDNSQQLVSVRHNK